MLSRRLLTRQKLQRSSKCKSRTYHCCGSAIWEDHPRKLEHVLALKAIQVHCHHHFCEWMWLCISNWYQRLVLVILANAVLTLSCASVIVVGPAGQLSKDASHACMHGSHSL